SEIMRLGGLVVEAVSSSVIDESFTVTGEIPSVYKNEPMPEQALVIRGSRGISVLTGCSHPGIITMVKRAREIYPHDPLDLVMGGFHLMNSDEEQIGNIVLAMKDLGVRRVAPTHCTGDAAISAFRNAYRDDFIPVAAGSIVEV
ncbi:MAG TPA: MBL fold metallo-hydrolase, partial [Spirochaetota bacterium]|nr:MBL fold metallo-hydrolase [Spirochaetota bacterium]